MAKIEYYKETEPKGEFVIIVEGASEEKVEVSDETLEKEFYELVNDGMHDKLTHMPAEARAKMRHTIEKIINEGASGLICILV